jgi:3-oxoacyl-[acyl-carrier protein] reductase
MTLQGKTAIVTGGSRGIGRAIAERLGRDGASVVVNYRSNREAAELVVKTIKDAGGQAVTAAADVATAQGVAALFEAARLEFGGVDIVVNNAAIFVGGPVEYISEADFDRLFAVNVKGVYFAAQQAAQYLRDGGRVINVSAGVPKGGQPFLGVYAASKAAVDALTRSLAHALGSRGITVNAVAPGPTDTDMLAPEARAGLDELIRSTPLGRLGQPADIAGVVAFLAGPDSGWVTGQSIHADGGAV